MRVMTTTFYHTVAVMAPQMLYVMLCPEGGAVAHELEQRRRLCVDLYRAAAAAWPGGQQSESLALAAVLIRIAVGAGGGARAVCCAEIGEMADTFTAVPRHFNPVPWVGVIKAMLDDLCTHGFGGGMRLVRDSLPGEDKPPQEMFGALVCAVAGWTRTLPGQGPSPARAYFANVCAPALCAAAAQTLDIQGPPGWAQLPPWATKAVASLADAKAVATTRPAAAIAAIARARRPWPPELSRIIVVMAMPYLAGLIRARLPRGRPAAAAAIV